MKLAGFNDQNCGVAITHRQYMLAKACALRDEGNRRMLACSGLSRVSETTDLSDAPEWMAGKAIYQDGVDLGRMFRQS